MNDIINNEVIEATNNKIKFKTLKSCHNNLFLKQFLQNQYKH